MLAPVCAKALEHPKRDSHSDNAGSYLQKYTTWKEMALLGNQLVASIPERRWSEEQYA